MNISLENLYVDNRSLKLINDSVLESMHRIIFQKLVSGTQGLKCCFTKKL